MLSCHARAGNIGWEGARRPSRCTRNRCLSAQSECKRSLPCRPKQRPVPDRRRFSPVLDRQPLRRPGRLVHGQSGTLWHQHSLDKSSVQRWHRLQLERDHCRRHRSFNTPGDLATPYPVYFQRVDTIVELAAARNMLVLLNPIETIGWLSVLRSNGMAKARDYGMFLGNRYRRFSNIAWMHGNDFQTWHSMTDNALVPRRREWDSKHGPGQTSDDRAQLSHKRISGRLQPKTLDRPQCRLYLHPPYALILRE